MRRTLDVQQDAETGELYIELPEDLIEEMGWSEGDMINWIDNQDGSWSLLVERQE